MPEQRQLLVLEVTSTGVRVVKGDLDALGGTGERTINTFGRLKSLLGGLISARMIRDVVMLADNYATMLNRVRVVTHGHEELRIAMRGVADISRATRSSLEANAAMYSRIAINTADFGLSQQQVLDFTKQLNQAIILSGVTAREAEWGMVQFSQGLASGALRGDELRAVLEQLPVVTQVLADHLKVGRGELRNLGFQGKITTQVMIQAFKEANDDLERRFGKTIPTINQAMTTLRSSWQAFIGSMDQSTGVTRTIAKMLLAMADNMNLFGRAAIFAGTALAAVLVVSMLRTLQVFATLKIAIGFIIANPVAAIILAAVAAVVMLSDKFVALADSIRFSSEQTASVGDLIRGILAELGNTVDWFMETWNALASTMDWSGLVLETDNSIQSIIMTFAKGFDTIAGVGAGFTEAIIALFHKLATMTVEQVAGWIKEVLGKLASFKEALKVFASGDVQGAMKLFDVLEWQRRQKAFMEEAAAGGTGAAEAAGETIGQAFMRGFTQTTPMTDFVKRSMENAQRIHEQRLAREAAGIDRQGNVIFTPAEQQMKNQITGPLEQYQSQYAALQRLRDLGMEEGGLEKGGITLDEYNRALDQITQKAATNERALKFMVENGVIDPVKAARAEWQLMNEDLKNSTDILSGYKRGFNEVLLTLSDTAAQSQKVVTNAFSGMEDAVVNFAQTGKFSIRDMVNQALADLTRLLYRALLLKALGALGGPVGSLASAASAVPAAPTAPTPGRANGGDVSPGSDYWVGEAGMRERFRPARPGTITPENRIGGEQKETKITIINVSSMEEVYAAMESTEGTRIIVNQISKAPKKG